MSAIIKNKVMHPKYLLGIDDIQKNLLTVPSVYRLTKTPLRMVDSYTDTTYTKVRLTDGRVVSTRYFKDHWKEFMPGVAELGKQREEWSLGGFMSLPALNRKIVRESSPYRLGVDIGQCSLKWSNGKARLRLDIFGTISSMYMEIDNIDQYIQLRDSVEKLIDKIRDTCSA